MILILTRFRGGPVEAFLGGASLETFSGGGQLKKSPCTNELLASPEESKNTSLCGGQVRSQVHRNSSGDMFVDKTM